MVHRGGGQAENLCNLLPAGVHDNIDKVHREQHLEKQLEVVIVKFKNGHDARMYLIPHLDDPIDDELLKEFQATCLLVHDL